MTSTLPTAILPSPSSLSLAEQVAQMMVVRASGHLFDHERRYPAWEVDNQTLSRYVQELGVGGVIFLGGSAAELGLRTQSLQTQAAIPLLLAADIEEGVGQRFSGATWFPPPLALSAIAESDLAEAVRLAEQMGAVTAQEALAIGLNWVLAPVVDVNNNPANPVINVRAFGQSPEEVCELGCAFIRGAKRHAVLTAAKHFPGHGDTAVDSHLSLPTIEHDRARLDQVELAPFRAAIAAGVDAVMTAHLQVPALDARHPATLSPAMLTGLLRQEMGFDGLIVTDALMMGAITRTYGAYEAAVMAVEAGADVLMMPPDPEGAIHAICEAVTIGRLPESRILDAVERIWRAKQKATALLTIPPESCHAWEHVPPPPVRLEDLAQPASRQAAAEILQASMTVRGRLMVDSISAATPKDNLLIVDDGLSCRFLDAIAPAIAFPQTLGYAPKLVDSSACRQLPDPAQLRPSLLQVFIRGNPFRGSAQLSEMTETWLMALLQANCLQAIAIYGSPYALEQFLPYLPEGLPYGFTYGQMLEAQDLLLRALIGSAEGMHHLGQRSFTD